MARMESEQRAKILDAAIGVFAEKGLKGATIRVVARRAGVNSAMLYYYFEDKQTLFAEAIHRVFQGFMDRLENRKKELKGAVERLECLVNGIFDYYTVHPERMRLMTLAGTTYPEQFGKALTGCLNGRLPAPLDILLEGMKKGELNISHPIGAWWCILGLCMFNLSMSEIVKHVAKDAMPLPWPDIHERKQYIIDLLVQGMTVGHPLSSKRSRRDKK